LLQPPTTSLTIPAEQDCHQLLTQPAAIASIKACATATSQSGTVTGTDEGYAHTQQWNVWKRTGNDAHLVLTYTGDFEITPGFLFHTADPANDADPKLLAIEHTPGTAPVSALDIIEATGVVVAHITIGAHGGVVGPAPNGGIETWATTTSSTADATIIRYTNGAWRIVSASSVPAGQVPAYPNDDGFGGGLP